MYKSAFDGGDKTFVLKRGGEVRYKAFKNLSRESVAVQTFGHEAAHSTGVDLIRDNQSTHYNAEKRGLDAMKNYRELYE